MSQCEWDPDLKKPARAESGCKRSAVFGVGTGRNNFHLCESCAALPRFKRFKKRPLTRCADRTG